jgi:hypothetical protein
MIVTYLLADNPKDSFRLRTFALLSKAYTSLSLSLASTYLGIPGPQIIAGNWPILLSTSDISQLHLVAEKNAWTYDPSTQILFPKMRSNTLNQIAPSSSEFGTFYSRSGLFIWPKASLPSIPLQIVFQDWSSEIV